MTTVFRADDLDSSDFDETLLAPPMATPLSGDIVVRDKSYLADKEHGVYSGSWESEPGTSSCAASSCELSREPWATIS